MIADGRPSTRRSSTRATRSDDRAGAPLRARTMTSVTASRCSRSRFLVVVGVGVLLLPGARDRCSRSCRGTSSAGSAATTPSSASSSVRCSSARSCCAPTSGASVTASAAVSSSSAVRARSPCRSRSTASSKSRAVPRGASRMLTGLGEAAFFVGAATMITDLAPLSGAARRSATGRSRSTAVSRSGPRSASASSTTTTTRATWLVAAGLGVVAVVLAACTREVDRPATPPATGPDHQPLRARARASCCSSASSASPGSPAFVPLYAEDLGLDDAGVVFLLYGVIVLVVRIVGARLPDRLGSRRAGTARARRRRGRLAIMAAWASDRPGCSSATAVFAAGMSLLYPAMLLLALDRRRPTPSGRRWSGRSAASSTCRRASAHSSLGGVAELGELPRRVRGSRARSRRRPRRAVDDPRARPARAHARSRDRRPPDPGSRRCRPCSSPTTSRRRWAGSSRTSTSCGGGCRPSETTVLTTPYAGDRRRGTRPSRSASSARASRSCCRPRRWRGASTRSRARSAPT